MKRFYLFLILVCFVFGIKAQTCIWTIKNFNHPSNSFEFDIYSQAVTPGNYLLCEINIGIDIVNYSALANGGVLSGSFVSGSNTLPAPQNNLSDCYVNTNTNQFIIPASSITSSAIMASITNTPLKIGTFRITNTQPFSCNVIPILHWHLDSNFIQTKSSIIVNNGPCSLPYTQTSFSYANQGPDYFVDTIGLGAAFNYVIPPQEVGMLCPGVPYSWHGNSYIQPGNYMDTVINAIGCDTLFNLLLQPLSGMIPYFSVIQCDTFLWSSNNQIYSNPGTYFNTNTINGCTFTDSFTYVMGSPSVQAPWNANSYAPYTWPINGQTYFQSGTYYDTSLNAIGCEVITALNLNIINPTNVQDLQNNKIRLYPNPTSQEIYLETSDNEVKSFRLFNVLGEELFHTDINPFTSINKIVIPSHLHQGLYFYRVQGRQQIKLQGILKLQR